LASYGAMPRVEEAILPLPSPRSLVPRTTQVKSAWISSSLRAIRDADLLDRYMSLLPEGYHDVVKNSAPSEWLDIDVAIVHYSACDKLEIANNVVVQLGHNAIKIGHGSPLSVVAKLASGAGASPWTLFGQLQRWWDKSWQGGAVGAFKLGPKEARLEVAGWPCAPFRYVRVGMRGVLSGAVELFCQKVYVQEIPELCTALSVGYRVSWV
jgi:hypothetical protein